MTASDVIFTALPSSPSCISPGKAPPLPLDSAPLV